MTPLTKSEREQISEILKRRAQEIAVFSDDYRREPSHYGSVEFALTREIERLRRLASRVNPPEPQEDDAMTQTQPAQPEAIRLANWIDSNFDPDDMAEFGFDEIAAELRRQQARIAKLEAAICTQHKENQRLRRNWCISYAGALAYMDDGEAQDSRDLPTINFLRDPVPEIEDKIRRRGAKALAGVKDSLTVAPAVLQGCWCAMCDMSANNGLRSRMSICPECRDKRCPRANHHGNACSAPQPPKEQT